MKVKYVKTADITPYERNAKKHPKHQVEQIAESLEMFGWQQPLVIDQNNVIVIGHGRFAAAELLGQEEVPCLIESSANVNTNPRSENTVLTVDKTLAADYLDIFNGIHPFNRDFDDVKPWAE